LTSLLSTSKVKVEPGSEEERLKDLKSALGSNDSAVYNLLNDGKIQEFTQTVNAKLSVLNVLSAGKDDEESRKNRQEVQKYMIKLWCSKDLPYCSSGRFLRTQTFKRFLPFAVFDPVINQSSNITEMFRHYIFTY